MEHDITVYSPLLTNAACMFSFMAKCYIEISIADERGFD